jgi:hypothetical protein
VLRCFLVPQRKVTDRFVFGGGVSLDMAVLSQPEAVSPQASFPQDGPGPWAGILVGLAYALIVLVMWGAFNIYSGFPYETGFPYNSETTSWQRGFLNVADPIRIHTNTFYQVSYLLGEVLHQGGSYVPFQFVYAVLWWARGFLVFLILRRFLPQWLTVCYTAGALVLVHASDGALQWVGQMNQFGFIFWMLLGFLLLTLAMEVRRYFSVLLLFLAGCCEYMSLWSYESQILLLLAFPLILLVHPRRKWGKLALLAIGWYSVPAVYIKLTIQKYMLSAGHSYQETVVRKTWGIGGIISDWWFNIAASLEFWKWLRGPWRTSGTVVYLLAALATAIFLACGFTVFRLSWKFREREAEESSRRTLLALLAVGMGLLILSFPVYLILDSARGLWRTQFLSGIGAGLVLTALAGLVSQVFNRQANRAVAFLTLGSVVVCIGSAAAIHRGAIHRWIWERHRTTMREVLQVAPSVRPNTVVVLTNITKDNDPFGHDMWYDMGLRLIYPGVDVSGIYFYADGTRAPGDNLIAKDGQWTWDQTGYPPLVRKAPMTNTIVVRYDSSGKGTIQGNVPESVCGRDCWGGLYNPGAMIAGPMSPRALRRYNMLP